MKKTTIWGGGDTVSNDTTESPATSNDDSLAITDRLAQQIEVRRSNGSLRSLMTMSQHQLEPNVNDNKEGTFDNSVGATKKNQNDDDDHYDEDDLDKTRRHSNTTTSSVTTGTHRPPLVDFASNDYLGLARCPQQARKVHEDYDKLFLRRRSREDLLQGNSNDNNRQLLGATGSRLLSGDCVYARQLEQWLARIHGNSKNNANALLCNSGYDANLSVVSSIPQAQDVVIMDSLCHNSLVMGLRMGRVSTQNVHTFEHNNVQHLEQRLQQIIISSRSFGKTTRSNSDDKDKPTTSRPTIFVVVESVYSMEGDVAPLRQICDLLYPKYFPTACLIVDEAHGLGVYGKTNVSDLKMIDDNTPHLPLDVKASLEPTAGVRTFTAVASYKYSSQVLEQKHRREAMHTESVSRTAEQYEKQNYTTTTRSRTCNLDVTVVATTPTSATTRREMTALPSPKSLSSSHSAQSSDPRRSIAGGTGVLAALGLERHPSLLCSTFTFGKAAGCHGAVIVSQHTSVIEYLVNYGRPFIYSTALPPHSLVTIHHAYQSMIHPSEQGERRRHRVFALVRLFRDLVQQHCDLCPLLLPSPSPIQALLIAGGSGANKNHACVKVARRLKAHHNMDVYPIRSPTVPKGMERIRIILHAHNTEHEVHRLVKALNQEMGRIDESFSLSSKHRSKL
jgi:7-keto-8-aminopelargonate synthetase-like enzyme